MIDLDALGRDLAVAYERRLARSRRTRKAARAGAAAALLACAFATVAVAGGIPTGLELNPTEWSILGGGSTDGGRGQYLHAQRKSDGSHSTFMVEHDAGLSPYGAFLLHERTRAAADATSPVPVRTEPGDLCTAAQLTRAERVALGALMAFAPGTAADATRAATDAALRSAFAGDPCRGLEYAGEQARLVYAGVEPRTLLMPGAR
jgi:hypothetical protein